MGRDPAVDPVHLDTAHARLNLEHAYPDPVAVYRTGHHAGSAVPPHVGTGSIAAVLGVGEGAGHDPQDQQRDQQEGPQRRLTPVVLEQTADEARVAAYEVGRIHVLGDRVPGHRRTWAAIPIRLGISRK
jgi:hypothetical protein